MDTPNLCENCGTPLAVDAPRGLCPACLMKVAMATGTLPGDDPKRFTPPGVEELAAKFPQLEIIEFIGRGGMGAVYKARQKELDRIVALKILPPDIGKDAAFAERFAREAKALAKLNHPGIITIYEFGRADGLYFFLMEFVDGVNLRQLLDAGRISPREALAIVPQICDALQFAHDRGIVHRDIKPENILLDRMGRVKVADFGLVKLVGAGSEAASEPEAISGSPELTEAGKVMGTPNYMAPEQKEHPQHVDHRADIYALGVVFYQMLTGELPAKAIEPPSRKVEIDVRLDEVVLRALEKEPERRYQQVSEVRTMVETIAGTSQSSPAGQPPLPVALEAARSRVRGPAIGLIVTGALNWVLTTAVFIVLGFKATSTMGLETHVVRQDTVLFFAFLGMALSGFVIYAGLKMMCLERRGAAMAGSILAAIVAPGNVIGLPVGIWALVVLTRREMREAFAANPAASMPAGAAMPGPATAPVTPAQLERARWLIVGSSFILCIVGGVFGVHLHPPVLGIALDSWGIIGCVSVMRTALGPRPNQDVDRAALRRARQFFLIQGIGIYSAGIILALINSGMSEEWNLFATVVMGCALVACILRLIGLWPFRSLLFPNSPLPVDDGVRKGGWWRMLVSVTVQVAATLPLLAFLTFIVPKFIQIAHDIEIDEHLPLLTKLVTRADDFANNHGWLPLFLMVIAVLLSWVMHRCGGRKLLWLWTSGVAALLFALTVFAFAVVITPIMVVAPQLIHGQPAPGLSISTTRTTTSVPVIEKTTVEANRAIVEGWAATGDRITFFAGGRSNGWACGFTENSKFIAKLEQDLSGLHCSVVEADGTPMLTLGNIKEIGSASLDHGRIVFRAGKPEVESNGDVIFADWVPDSGKSVPVGVRLIQSPANESASNQPVLTQNRTLDIQPDGLIRSKGTVEVVNDEGETLRTTHFINSDFVHVEKIEDAKGRAMAFQAKPGAGNHIEYDVTLNEPVAPGGMLSFTIESTETGRIKATEEPGVFQYSVNQWPSYDGVTRSVELHRLPPGAELIDKSPDDLKEQKVGDHIELHIDHLIPRDGNLEVRYRFRLANQVVREASEKAVRAVAAKVVSAMRAGDDAAIKANACDLLAGARVGLPVFAKEIRGKLQELAGDTGPLEKIDEVYVDGDFAAVKTAKLEKAGVCLILFFADTPDGWRNWTLRNAPMDAVLKDRLAAEVATLEDAFKKRAVDFLDLIKAGKFAAAAAQLSETMRREEPETRLAEDAKEIETWGGKLLGHDTPRVERAAEYYNVYVPCRWERGTVDIRVTFDLAGQVSGLDLKQSASSSAEAAGQQTLAGQRPVVVETIPVSGARDVAPGETEIRVRFSKEMTGQCWCTAWNASTPEMIYARYEADRKVCVAKVILKPGRTYAFWLNTDSEDFQNFKDNDGHPAVPYLLIFQTKPE